MLMNPCSRHRHFHEGKTPAGAEGTGPNPKCDLRVLDHIGQEKQEQRSKGGRKKADFPPELQMSLSLPNDNYTQPIKTPL